MSSFLCDHAELFIESSKMDQFHDGAWLLLLVPIGKHFLWQCLIAMGKLGSANDNLLLGVLLLQKQVHF